MKGSEQRNAHFPSLTTLSLMGRATRNRHLWKPGSDIFGMTPKENQRIDCVVLSTSVYTFLLMMVPKMRETRLKMSRFIHQKTPPPKKAKSSIPVFAIKMACSCWMAIDQLYLCGSKTKILTTTRGNNDFMISPYSFYDQILILERWSRVHGRDRKRASTMCWAARKGQRHVASACFCNERPSLCGAMKTKIARKRELQNAHTVFLHRRHQLCLKE